MLASALRGLARTQKCEEGVLEVNLHYFRHGKSAIAQAEVALVRLRVLLDAMTGEMDDVGGLEGGDDVLLGSSSCHDVGGGSGVCGYLDDQISFAWNMPKKRQIRVLRLLYRNRGDLDLL
jgi:hypothetical protein